MSTSCKVGSFNARAGTGVQAVTGVGFQPKGLIIWSQMNSIGSPFDVYRYSCFGFSDGIFQVGGSASENRNNTPSDVNNSVSQVNIIFGVSFNNSQEMVAGLTSFDVDGFTLTWGVNSFAAAPFFYIAFGGTSVSCKAAAFASSAGVQAITGVGFKPTVLFGMIGMNGGVNQSAESFGWSDGINDGSILINSRNASNPGHTISLQRDAIYTYTDFADDSIDNVGKIQSFDADGFTINWLTHVSSIGGWYLALNGFACKVGKFNQPLITGVQAIDTLIPSPRATLLMGVNKVGSLLVQPGAALFKSGIGLANQVCMYTASYNGNAVSESARNQRTDVAVVQATIPVPPALAVLNSLASGTLPGTTINLNWTTIDAIAREILYIYLADTISAPDVIDAGQDKNALLSTGTDLLATCVQILPATFLWTKGDGPGDCVFSSPTALATHVDFTKNGKYILKITATSGTLISHSYIVITVLDQLALPTTDPVL